MIRKETQDHFDEIADTWTRKGWVNSNELNGEISKFIRKSEIKVGLDCLDHRSMLYLGIGTGALFEHLQRYHIAGVDRASNMLGQCPEGIIQILSSCEELPFLMPNQFHAGFFRNLLKHCESPEEATRTFYEKIREGFTLMGCESIVYDDEDINVPTSLVRLTDPSHPPFLSLRKIIEVFKGAGFRDISYRIFPFRDRWLGKWLDAEQAPPEIHREVLNLYEKNKGFREKYDVEIHPDGDITSTVPWALISARK